MATGPTETDVLKALSGIIDPDLKRDIVSLGFVQNMTIDNGTVSFDLVLTTPACPVREQFRQQCQEAVGRLDGVNTVNVELKAEVRKAQAPPARSGDQDAPATPGALAGVKNIIAVASGKGGVGKSTVAVNLAIALADTGAVTALMDADVYGPSVPIMLGLVGQQPEPTEDEEKILPLEAHGIRAMSLGFLTDTEAPVIWRGPMVHKTLQQLLEVVQWGELDYLIIDMPPGTGDAQLTLTQSVSLSGAVIVTTPQDVALLDARKGLHMFQRVNVPVLGIVENMSFFACPHCGKTSHIFSSGGGKRTADKLDIPLLGQIPIDPAITEGGDSGVPISRSAPDSEPALAYRSLAGKVAAQLSTLAMQPDNPADIPGMTFQ